MPLTYKQIVKILKDFWFVKIRTRGSHERYELNWYRLTVAFHKEFPPKTSKSMLNDISKITGEKYEELIKKYKIKI